MPRRTDLKRILVIGAGPIIIGQACEFDYSGTQACKALKEEGYQVILVNSNPATVMTDPSMSDKTYIEPLTVEVLEKIIAKENPCAILPTLGGQTGLNLAIALHEKGILKKYQVEMVGANADVIHQAEDRAIFKKIMTKIGLSSAPSATVHHLSEAKQVIKTIGYPCVVRPAFTLGGTGGGIAHDDVCLEKIVKDGLQNSLIQSVLIESSLIGWKEYELEVMRDKNDNTVIVCTIENFDPMGVHTGDSITVAPAQTLTDKEMQKMRNAAIAIMRAIGVTTGGANVQFAVHPRDGRMMVIEMNPRVSRSSALASKATGFPIAKIAAKLAVGYTLDELQNDITKKTPACFEPTIDYVVTKIPRFNFSKFIPKDKELGTTMKSVGEAMAIGRTFKESLQKCIRSLENRRLNLLDYCIQLQSLTANVVKKYLIEPTPERLFYMAYAFQEGMTIDEMYRYTAIDPWFLKQIEDLVKAPAAFKDTSEAIFEAKKLGFTDAFLTNYLPYEDAYSLYKKRKALGITPVYKLVDTCANEFEAATPYYYATYEQEDEVTVSERPKVMILGSGPNRIGQGIEFDYCCVHAALAAKEVAYETIMVNANPETVSTDFDIADKLYFEPLTFEDVLAVYEKEKPQGIIIQFGGQTPLNLSKKLAKAGVKILGTSCDSIDVAEDRKKFGRLLSQLQLSIPQYATVMHTTEALEKAATIGYPVMVRPSYVLGGTAMQICYTADILRRYIEKCKKVSPQYPILIDKYFENAIEVDVDALSDGEDCIIAGILEHIELAGVHSGDSSCVFPTYSLSKAVIDQIKQSTKRLAQALHVVGLINIQFAIKEEQVYILEVNPRASRTVPFISKATGISWAKFATQVILGKKIKDLSIQQVTPDYFAVKEVVFPYNKFSQTDPVRKTEMCSTGEVMGIDKDYIMAYYKAQLAAGTLLPLQKRQHVSIHCSNLQQLEVLINLYYSLGFRIRVLGQDISSLCLDSKKKNITFTPIVLGEEYQLLHALDLLISIPMIDDTCKRGVNLRKLSIAHNIPLITSFEAAKMSALAIQAKKTQEFSVQSLQDYYATVTV